MPPLKPLPPINPKKTKAKERRKKKLDAIKAVEAAKRKEIRRAEYLENKPGKGRGFASMSPRRLREVSARGGKNCPDDKRAFSRDPELAREAARKRKKEVENGAS